MGAEDLVFLHTPLILFFSHFPFFGRRVLNVYFGGDSLGFVPTH